MALKGVVDVVQKLERAGVVVGRHKARDSRGRVRDDKFRRVDIKRWLDGSWTVNLVEVPQELAEEAWMCGLGAKPR